MRTGSTRGNNAEPQNLCDDFGRFAGAVHAAVGGLIRRQALGIERAKTGFVAEERPAGHGHAAGKQNFDGAIEPQDGCAGGTQKVRATRLGVCSPTKGEHCAFSEFGGAAQCGAKLVGFELAKKGLAEALEDLRNAKAGGFLDTVVEIDKAPCELPGKERANSALPGAHESGEAKNRGAGFGAAQKRRSCHARKARKINRASECELYHCRKIDRPSPGLGRRFRTVRERTSRPYGSRRCENRVSRKRQPDCRRCPWRSELSNQKNHFQRSALPPGLCRSSWCRGRCARNRRRRECCRRW